MNETILIDSQPIPAEKGKTLFTDKEVVAIIEARQRLNRYNLGPLEDMFRELHRLRVARKAAIASIGEWDAERVNANR